MAVVPARLGVVLRLAPIALILGAGCGLTSRTRLDDCARRVQALQAENAHLRDERLGLRSRNRELAQRAVDDSRQIRRLQEANRNLERSVLAYQDERDDLVEAFDEVRHLVRGDARGPTASTRPESPRSLDERLLSLARSHPGCGYDPQRRVWSIPADQLFQPDSADYRPGAELLVRALARLLAEEESTASPIRVVAQAVGSPVRLASTAPPAGEPEALARARANRVGEVLAETLDPGSETIPLKVSVDESASTGGDDEGSGTRGSIQIHLSEAP